MREDHRVVPEVFNVLVIIGTAVLATPKDYMPLKLSKTSSFREPSSVYMVKGCQRNVSFLFFLICAFLRVSWVGRAFSRNLPVQRDLLDLSQATRMDSVQTRTFPVTF